MSIFEEPQTAQVCVTNKTSGEARIILFHQNSVYPLERGSWTVPAGETSPPMTVSFNTGLDTIDQMDDWSIMLFVKDGPEAGTYWNGGSIVSSVWKECQLQGPDAGQTLTFTVDTGNFGIALDSGPCPDPMVKIAPAASAPITHVFVVMLENHSFDHMFAMSGIPGIVVANTSDKNDYLGQPYYVSNQAPPTMPTDPGHEFMDVLQQLTGLTSFAQGQTYGPITNANFVTNYATSTSEWPNVAPPSGDWGDIMACVDSTALVPTLTHLAGQFGVCDSWYSSLPGPTWPNRFFVHGASSANLVESPDSTLIALWEEIPGGGFVYPNGSVYDMLGDNGIPYVIYHDDDAGYSQFSPDPNAGSVLGSIPQVQAIKRIEAIDNEPLTEFTAALQGPYPYPYTFIEPHYGDVGDSYQGGSSQHPMDSFAGGEALINYVVGSIAVSPFWATSLILILYDEHGGFYDSVAPGSAAAPNDNPDNGFNTLNFDFTTYGVRVPAVVVSPLIPKATVSHTVYDHSSVPKTLEALWGLGWLTDRDKGAESVLPLLTLAAPRTDALELPPAPPAPRKRAPLTEVEQAARRARPIPERGNLVGTIGILRKMDAELSAEAPDLATPRPMIATVGEAEDYAVAVRAKLDEVRARRETAAAAARATGPRKPRCGETAD